MMLLLTSFVISGLFAIGALSVEAAEFETQVVDKNCWIEVYDKAKYDADHPHVTLQGPSEYVSLKNLQGKDWSNEIQSVIVGPSASVLAYSKRDFNGTELAFTQGQRVPNLSKLDMSNEIESLKINCGETDDSSTNATPMSAPAP